MKKRIMFWGMALILAFALGFSCTHNVRRTEETGYSSFTERQKVKETSPTPKIIPFSAQPSASPAPGVEKHLEKPLKEETLRPQTSPPTTSKEGRREKDTRQTSAPQQLLQSIFFDFDQAIIREDQKSVMLQNAQWLKANPQVRIRIEGNCDERGTAEYNLALGQRRAEAAREFLEGLGISPTRMQTISYGFERPLDPGHNEEAWAKNRRVDFTILK